MYRISATLLEKFRRFLAADDSNYWDSERAVFESLTGIFEGNDKTRIGSAFHKLIELGQPERKIMVDGTEYHLSEGFAFTEEQANVAYEYKAAHPLMIPEVPIGRPYQTPLAWFYISGRVDGIEGALVRDPKTKYSTPEAQAYLDSFQWRIYLDILGVREFYYDIFEVKSFPRNGIEAAREIEIDSAKQFIFFIDKLRFQQPIDISCFAYPEMKRDIYQLLCAFVEWIQDRNYWHLLKQCNADGTTTAPATSSPTGATQAQTSCASSYKISPQV